MKRKLVKRIAALSLSACLFAGVIFENPIHIYAAEVNNITVDAEQTDEEVENANQETDLQTENIENTETPVQVEEEEAADVNVETSEEQSENTPEKIVTTAEEITEEPIEENVEESQDPSKENSWRYQEGIPFTNEISPRSVDAWKKVNGHFVNSKGEIIPGAVKKGIDVSEHNGTIDWEKVKADGIDFAIIRCGYGMDMQSQDDKQWLRNVKECERLGIPYGVYLYSYANTLEKAKSEAQHVLRLLRGHTPAYPVYYDLEDKLTFDLPDSMKAQVAKIFCDTVSAAGYRVGIYSNLEWWTKYLLDPVFNNKNWSRWMAQWSDKCTYKGTYDVWQCSSVGQVNGISGNVDLNFWMASSENNNNNTSNNYKDGLHYDRNSGTWRVYKNGAVNTKYTGILPAGDDWYYIRNGIQDKNYTGVAPNEWGWWYIRNGVLDWNYTGVACNEWGWWYIKNGALDWNHTGVEPNEWGWWYIKNGALDWSYTGVASNEWGWWYIKDGGLDWNYTGVGKNEWGWWYIKNGTIDWNYTGSVRYNNKQYRVVGGSVIH